MSAALTPSNSPSPDKLLLSVEGLYFSRPNQRFAAAYVDALLGENRHEPHRSVQLPHCAAVRKPNRRAVQRALLHIVSAGVRRAGGLVGIGIIGQKNRVQLSHERDRGFVASSAHIRRQAGYRLLRSAGKPQRRKRRPHLFRRSTLRKRRLRLH